MIYTHYFSKLYAQWVELTPWDNIEELKKYKYQLK